jgi:hypothetical protein
MATRYEPEHWFCPKCCGRVYEDSHSSLARAIVAHIDEHIQLAVQAALPQIVGPGLGGVSELRLTKEDQKLLAEMKIAASE